MNTIYGGEIQGNLGLESEKRNKSVDFTLPTSLNIEKNNAEASIKSLTENDLQYLKSSTAVSNLYEQKKNLQIDYKDKGKRSTNSVFKKWLDETYKDNHSLDGAILKNKDTQELFGSIMLDVTQNVKEEKAKIILKLERKKKREKEINATNVQNNEQKKDNIIADETKTSEVTEKDSSNNTENIEKYESLDEYYIHEATQENFQKFLVSPEGLRIFKEELEDNKDKNTGKINIDYSYLKDRLQKTWRISIQKEWEEKYNMYDENTEKIINVGKDTLGSVSDSIKSFIKGEINEKQLIENFDNILSGEEIKQLLGNNDFKDSIRNSIRAQIITSYKNLDTKNKYVKIFLNSGSKKMDLSIKSYLYLYGKIFFSDTFPKKCGSLSECENDLNQIMEAILLTDGTIKYNKKLHSKNKYRRKEKDIEDKNIENDIRRKKDFEGKMQELNAKNSYNRNSSREGRFGLDNDGKSLDVNKASGLEIADSLNLGKKLSKYKINGNESIDENMEHDIISEAFQQCFRPFLETSYKEGQQMKSVIDESQMRKIYNFENNSINTSEFEIYKNRLLKQGFDNDDINQIYGNLNRFLGMMNEAISKVGDEAMNKQGKFGERVKTHAVGAIIDNIKAIFSQSGNDKLGSIFEGFQFDNNSPVDIIGNDMLIHGKMNGVKVTISYKLDNGEIYINSFIQKKIVSPKITIGNMEPDYKIGQIDSFDKILDNYYKLPTISNSGSENYKMDKNQRAKMVNDNRLKFQELFGTKLDVIGEMAKYHIEKQGVRNSVIKTFCNTFHMNQEKLEVTEGSNLYDTLDIISNSDTDTLASFSKNMEIFLNYFGLKWGDENNILDERKSIIFDEDSRVDEGIKDIQGGMMNKIKESMKNFNNEKNKITYNNTGNFDNTYNIGLAGIIKEYMKEGSKPGWKLDITKMEQFLKKFNIGLSELNQKKNELSDLDEKFDEA